MASPLNGIISWLGDFGNKPLVTYSGEQRERRKEIETKTHTHTHTHTHIERESEGRNSIKCDRDVGGPLSSLAHLC